MLQRKRTIYVTHIPAFLFCQMNYYFTKSYYQTENKTIKHNMRLGKQVHSSLFNSFYHQSDYYTSFNNAAIQTLKDGKVRRIRELLVVIDTDSYTLRGKIDEIRIEPSRIFIIDDKKTNYLTPAMQIMYQQQVELYCEMFIRQYIPFLDVYYGVRKAETDHFFFKNQFTHVSFDLDQVIQLLLDYWNGEFFLRKTTNVSKCAECRFYSLCKSE